MPRANQRALAETPKSFLLPLELSVMTPIALTWVATFIQVEVIEHSFNVSTILKTAFLQSLLQTSRGFISPPLFAYPIVPHRDLFVGRVASIRKAPLQQFFVGSPMENAFGKLLVVDSKETTSSPVEAQAQHFLIIAGQAAGHM